MLQFSTWLGTSVWNQAGRCSIIVSCEVARLLTLSFWPGRSARANSKRLPLKAGARARVFDSLSSGASTFKASVWNQAITLLSQGLSLICVFVCVVLGPVWRFGRQLPGAGKLLAGRAWQGPDLAAQAVLSFGCS